MKNTQICKNCGAENPFYVNTCLKCNFFIRDKIVNIDLWSAISGLIESPVKTFETIIQSEHKNFVISIILFAGAKLSINSAFLSLFLFKNNISDFEIFSNIFIAVGILLIILLGFAFIIKLITANTQAKSRFKDNLGILVYSLIPYCLALCIVFPIELAVFGGYVFSANPSPFILKPNLAYVLSGFELLVFLWSIFLAIMGIFSQTRSKIFGLIGGLIFGGLIFAALYFLSMLR
jgi:Yip1 domain